MDNFIYPPYDCNFDYSKYNLEYDLIHGIETLSSLILDKETICAIHTLEKQIRKGRYHRCDYLDFCGNLSRNNKKKMLSEMLTDFNKVNANSSQPMYAFITIGWNEQTNYTSKNVKSVTKYSPIKIF